MRKWLTAVVLALLAMFGLKVMLEFHRMSIVRREFRSIKPGQTKEQVIAKLGWPNRHAGPCGYIQPSRGGCVLEFVYSNPYDISEIYDIVTFASDGRVIEAHEWGSP